MDCFGARSSEGKAATADMIYLLAVYCISKYPPRPGHGDTPAVWAGPRDSGGRLQPLRGPETVDVSCKGSSQEN